MAGTDIFGYKRNPKPDGVFSSEDSALTVSGTSMTSSPYLVQNWNTQYSQNVEELFEIGSNRLYWNKGRPVGQGSIGRIVGGAAADTGSSGLFPKEAFDICDGGATFVIKATGGHCTSGSSTKLDKGVTITMSGVVVTSLGFTMAVQDVRIVESYGWRFAHLEISA